MGQEIIDIRDIKGGSELVDNNKLNTTLASYVKESEVNSFLIPQFIKTFTKANLVWEQDWIKIAHTGFTYSKNVKVRNFTIRMGHGDIQLEPVISYPRAEIYNGSVFQGFYIKDANGIITKNNDIEFVLRLEYDLLSEGSANYDLRAKIGKNAVLDHNQDSTSHSSSVRNNFMFAYPELFEQYGVDCIRSDTDPIANNTRIIAAFEPKYAELKKADIFIRPYVGGASSEQRGSNPNILKVAAHYGNYGQMTPQRQDITPNANTFLSNTIAVGARVDDTVTLVDQSSYGFGMEFFEDWTNMDDELPDPTFYAAVAQVHSTDLNHLYSTDHPNFLINNQYRATAFYIGQKVWVHYKNLDPFECTIKSLDTTPDANGIEIEETLPEAITDSPKVYIHMYLTFTQNQGGKMEQSPTCGVVAAKLKKIQLLTDVSWSLIREAARMTASNSTYTTVEGKKVWTTNWDMYRGFGKIRTDLAIEYIQDNYLNNQEYKDTIVPTVPKVNSILSLDDLENDNTVNKKMLLKAIDDLREELKDYIKNDLNI